MKVLEILSGRRRLILTLALMVSMVGGLMWMTMIRQEDPRLPDFWGQIVSAYPGADAATVEHLVLEPLEDELSEVSEIKQVESTAYDEVAVTIVELRGDTSDFSEAWDEVREALQRAYAEFPQGARHPVLDDDVMDQDSIVLGITGSGNLLELLNGARKVKDRLLALPLVARVEVVADPGEQVTVDLDDAVAKRLGIDAMSLANQLKARNQLIPGGSIRMSDKTVRLRPLSEFASVKEIAQTPILLSSASSVPLGEIARVHLGPREPLKSKMRINGEMALGIAVVPRRHINLVDFGDVVRDAVTALRPVIHPLKIQEVTFQPKRTKARLKELGQSLVMGILIVGGILIMAMGLRMGLIVASVVPLVTLSSLAVFAWGGGVLHQISIAAFVLALGMLVDNAIVVAENIQWRLDRGESRQEATMGTVRELAIPLAGATATTVAAFIPMLIAKGPTAEFTQSIPVVIILTLSVSYLFALLVTPALCHMGLKPRTGEGYTGSRVEQFGARLARIAVHKSGWVIGLALVVVVGSFMGTRWVRQQFFPSSDRNQCVIDLKLPEGSHLDATDEMSRHLEKALLARPEVVTVCAVMGRSVPKFYYNIRRIPFSPHLAQFIVETRQTSDIEPLLAWVRNYAKNQLPSVELVAGKLEQGPPVGAPVEIRLYGPTLQELSASAAMVASELKQIRGATDVRHDLGPGGPTIRFHINDAAAARYGITRAHIARALYGQTRGIPIGQLHSGDDPIPVVIRSSAGENMALDHLETLAVPAADGRLIPLSQVANHQIQWQPAAIRHWNSRRVVTVSAQLLPGYTFSDVLKQLEPRLRQLNLPDGVDVDFGGDAEGSGEASMALLKTFPIGLLLLLGVLLAEFNSFRRMAIILVTVPLAAAGVIPGLLIGHQPFGFMSMLGVIALVGIVVNNAIVLLEVVEDCRNSGDSIEDAVEKAVSRRIRPILLTTATTVAGLIPLAMSSSTLWPPLASAMISGLLASTLLTLVVVPALYWVLFKKRSVPWAARFGSAAKAVSVLVVIGGFWGSADAAQNLTLTDAMHMAMDRPAAKSADLNTEAAERAAQAEGRAAYFPVISASVSHTRKDRELTLETPIGAFPFGQKRSNTAAINVMQPILDPVRLFYTHPAAMDEALASDYRGQWKRRQLAAEAGDAFLNVLALDAQMDATRAFIKSLEARLEEIQSMVNTGRALEADALKVQLAHDQANQDMAELRRARELALDNLARVVNSPGPVVPEPVPDMMDRVPPSIEEMIGLALDHRPDVAAVRKSIEALKKRSRAIRAEAWPRLDANATWIWNDPPAYSQNQWVEGSLTLTWTPWASGTRTPRYSAMMAKVRALENDLQELVRGVKVAVRSAIHDIQNANDRFRVEQSGVVQATETLRVEQARHREGRSTTNDLLDAEAQLRERTTRREMAKLERIRAWIQLWLVTGMDQWPM